MFATSVNRCEFKPSLSFRKNVAINKLLHKPIFPIMAAINLIPSQYSMLTCKLSRDANMGDVLR